MLDLKTSLLILIFISIAVAIFAKQFEKSKLFIVTKPLTMLLIIALPLLDGRYEYSRYAYIMVTALSVSLLGDLFLLFPDKYFNNGLYSFLAAHLLFILAFNLNSNHYSLLLVFPIIIYIFVVLRYLYPKLGHYKYPVSLYVGVISVMLYSAVNTDLMLWGRITYLTIGALLFVASDTVLAFNKFYKKFQFADTIILGTYFLAQLFFAFTI